MVLNLLKTNKKQFSSKNLDRQNFVLSFSRLLKRVEKIQGIVGLKEIFLCRQLSF